MTRTKSIYLALLAVVLSPIAAKADPVSFTFEYPLWESNNDAALFGTNPILTITLDNGSSSTLNQTYNVSTDTIEIAVSVNGGTYSNVWLGSEILYIDGSSTWDYISTDGTGTPILNLVPESDTRVVWSNSSGTWQMGRNPSYTQSWLEIGPGFTGDSRAYHNRDINSVIIGSTTTVPEPGTLALLGLGLVGMAATRCRRKA